MRILVVTQYFWPEEFFINDLVLSLRAMGHDIEVLTGLPNYPTGQFFEGYGYRGPYRQEYQGIPIWRSPLIPRANGAGWRLGINYLSFAVSACIRGLLACSRRFEAVLVFEVSPITVGIPARMMKFISGAKMFFWVQDLWPDSLKAAGGIRSERLLSWAGNLTRWIYRGADCILIHSRAFRDHVIKTGANGDCVHYFPEWAEDLYRPIALPAEAPERRLMPTGFRIMFAGNLGEAQDLETILAAAELTRSSSIRWLIVGDGRRAAWLREEAQRRELTKVHLLGRYPKEKMPSFFSLADVMLVSLKKEPIFSMTLPTKVQAYLACGKPLLASVDGEVSRIVQEAEAGITVPAESPQELAMAAMKFTTLGPEQLQTMGLNARRYYESHFSRNFLLSRLDGLFRKYCLDSNNGKN